MSWWRSLSLFVVHWVFLCVILSMHVMSWTKKFNPCIFINLNNIEFSRTLSVTGLMCEILWSDPQPNPGRGPSKRGVGLAFGADVTKRFLQENNLGNCFFSHIPIPLLFGCL